MFSPQWLRYVVLSRTMLSLALAFSCVVLPASADGKGGLKFSPRCLMVNPNECPAGDPLAGPWKFHPETALPSASSPWVVADVNGDGRNDLVWGRGHDYGVYWWEQGEPKSDGTTTWTEHLVDKSWSQAHSMAWADLDGDGRGELITGKRVRGHGGRDPGAEEPPALFYYTWDSRAEEFIRFTIAPPNAGVGTGMQICVADLTGDGRPDIAVAGKTGTHLLINEGR